MAASAAMRILGRRPAESGVAAETACRRGVSRASRSATVFAALALFALLGCSPGDREPPSLSGAASGWNLWLLSLDTVRADRLGAYGYEKRDTMPRLDSLIDSGVRFERAVAPRASTWPSLGSVLTGLYPTGHGLIGNGYSFADAMPTLPKLLHAAGYQTGRFLSNMCHANHQGWDAFYCSRSVDTRLEGRVRGWLGQLEAERPFFLWTHYFAAHPPYDNGGELARELLDPGYDGPLAPEKWRLDRVMTEKMALTERDLAHLDALYDAALMGTDALVGAMLEALRETGRLERTLIVVLADHGEDLYQHHGYLYHACSVYQSGLHVPLAFVAPGLLPEVRSVPQVVELIDVAPTLLELLGVPGPREVHGRSLVPWLEGRRAAAERRPAFSEYGDTRVRTVQTERWKLVDNPDHHVPLCFKGAPPDLYPLEPAELYDLAADPGETSNLAAAEPETVDKLRRLIAQRFAGLSGEGLRQEIPEDLKKELEALGYLAN